MILLLGELILRLIFSFCSQNCDRTRLSYAAGHARVNRATRGKLSRKAGRSARRDIVKIMSNKGANPLALSPVAIVGFRPGKVVGPFCAIQGLVVPSSGRGCFHSEPDFHSLPANSTADADSAVDR